MPRQPRLILPEVAVHIIQRGNNRGACFHADSDYLVYLQHLRELSGKFDCSVHAYCLMPNHVHLLLTPRSPDSCTGLMRDLGQRYVQYFNRRHRRTGTLWEGRFRSCIAESARYVLACYRYIELNPVRAALVADPRAYPWSSFRANVGEKLEPLISPHSEYRALGSDAYLGLIQDALDHRVIDQIRLATNGGYPLASDSFKAALGKKTEPGRAGRPSKQTTDRASEAPEIGL
jgi:putative transposase